MGGKGKIQQGVAEPTSLLVDEFLKRILTSHRLKHPASSDRRSLFKSSQLRTLRCHLGPRVNPLLRTSCTTRVPKLQLTMEVLG